MTAKKAADYDPIRDGLAESWHDAEHPPQEGDTLIGTVVAVDFGMNQYGRYPIVTVADENDNDERKAFHGFHTVARNQLNKVRPRVGERIRIECLGAAQTKGSRGDYWNWSVRVDRKIAETDWDAAFGAPDEGLAPQGDSAEAGEPVAATASQASMDEEPPF